jgi:O-antigen/teichoic acid export membrane protein
MSRLRYYVQSLVSGYVVIGANIVYTLCSVPLALQFLSRAEFGLWALATQIAFYLALLDFGMTGAVSRILVDYKDTGRAAEYASFVQTSLIINVLQAAVVLVAGIIAAYLLGPILNVPVGLRHEFRLLMVGQTLVVAAAFALKIFTQILTGHQRSDIVNWVQSLSFVLSLAALWVCFQRGVGIYSVVWAQAASLALSVATFAVACFRLSVWPSAFDWRGFDCQKLGELWHFSKDVFILSLGSQLINTSQIIIVTRTLGLESAAIWSICTRSFILMSQFVGRVLDFSAIPLSEMFARGEHGRLLHRFRGITVLSTSMAIVAAVLFVNCNQPFVSLWTGREFTWSFLNDMLLGIWFVFITIQRCHIGLLGVSKQLTQAKYIYLAEGLVFIILSLIVARFAGFNGIIASSVICTGCFSLVFGLHQTQTRFRLTRFEWMRDWVVPSIRVLAVAVPIGVLAWGITAGSGDLLKLAVRGAIVFLGGGFALWRWGLGPDLQSEILGRSPRLVRLALAMTLKPLRKQA